MTHKLLVSSADKEGDNEEVQLTNLLTNISVNEGSFKRYNTEQTKESITNRKSCGHDGI